MDFMSQERLLASEIMQRREEGCDVTSIERRLASILEDREDNWDGTISSLWVDLEQLTPEPGFKYHEPSDIESIRASRPEGKRKLEHSLTNDEYFNKVYGAWLGRCVGCVLGKPVEGWPRDRIEG